MADASPKPDASPRPARSGSGYRDLVAWQRAAASVPANIAEGQGLGTPKQFHHHLSIAYGSLCELETHQIVAQRLAYIDQATLDAVIQQSTDVARPLFGLMRSLR